MYTPIYAIFLAAAWAAAPVGAADVRESTVPDLREGAPVAPAVFDVEQNAMTPAMEIYLSAVTSKIRQRSAQDWPVDGAGKRVPGAVVVRLQLRKDGRIGDLRVIPVSDSTLSGNNAVLTEAVTRLVQGAQPFPPFSASLFAGHDLIAFGTTVAVSSGGADKLPGEIKFGAYGDNQDLRLQIRSRIPF